MNTGNFSQSRLGRLQDRLALHVEHGGVPGLVALAYRRGELHAMALGTRDMDGPEPVRRDTIFRISSMTKPVTAVAALILVEECKLRLDDPLDELLPELSQRQVLARLESPLDDTVPAERPITLRDLLTFRMGFGQLLLPRDALPILRAAHEQRIGMGPPQPALTPPPDEWLRRLGALPLMAQPGERWLYNTGSDVLGVLIERASGQRFERFLAERLFEPLGMKDTGFSVPPAALGRFVPCYWNNVETHAVEVFDPVQGQWSQPPLFASGAGGLVSTADDYLAFLRMLLNGGRHGGLRILSRPSVEALTTDQLTPAQKAHGGLVDGHFDSHGWGLGVSIVTRRDDTALSVGSFGWDGGLGTSGYADPREGVIGVLLTQRAWTSPRPPAVCRDFWTGLYQAIDD